MATKKEQQDSKKGYELSTNPLISVIVPVYNVKEFLDSCIQSIVRQTYRNLEIILIDDGSIDGSGELCDEWATKDDRILVIHSENRGVSHARNLGLDKASGEVIGFVDSDDWLDHRWFEILINQMVREKSDIVIGGYIRDDGHKQWMRLKKGSPRSLTSAETLSEMFQVNENKYFWWEIWDKIFKRSIFHGLRLDERITMAEDMLLCGGLVMNAENVSYIPAFGYHYRVRAGSATQGGASEKDFATDSLAKKLLWLYAQKRQNTAIIQIIGNFYFKNLISHLRLILHSEDYQSHKKEILAGQSEIRHGVWSVLDWKNSSLRNIIGVIYFVLPYGVVVSLRKWACRKND